MTDNSKPINVNKKSSMSVAAGMEEEEEEISLVESYSKLLHNEQYHDVQLHCVDGKRVGASRFLLAARSEVLHGLLMGKFQEASCPVVQVGYAGKIMQALVEYVYTNTAELLDVTSFLQSTSNKKKRKRENDNLVSLKKEAIFDLVSLTGAAYYYKLPLLRNKAIDSICELLRDRPKLSFSALESCEQHGPAAPDKIHNFAMNLVRSSEIAKNVCAEDVRGIGVAVMEDLLQDKLMQWDENQLFRLILLWKGEGAAAEENVETAKDLMGYIKLERISPSHLCTTVASSGLVSQNQISEALKLQALAFEEKCPNEFGKARFGKARFEHVWRSSGTSQLESSDGESIFDVLSISEAMINGAYRWSVHIDNVADESCIYIGICAAGKASEHCKTKEYNLGRYKGGIAFSESGDTYIEKEEEYDLDENLVFSDAFSYCEGDTLCFVLDVHKESPSTGTLTVSKNGGPFQTIARGLFYYLKKYPSGFLPAARVPRDGKLSLKSFEKLY